MSANFLPPMRTPAQNTAEDVAEKIFRECGFMLHHVRYRQLMIRRVTRMIQMYSPDPTKPNPTAQKIAFAYPGYTIQLTGYRTVREWAEAIAADVIMSLIQVFVSPFPKFGWRYLDDEWIFLGTGRRGGSLPLDALQTAAYDEHDRFVDYWGRRDGSEVVVVYSPEGIQQTSRRAKEHCDAWPTHIKEGFRRLDQVFVA